MKSLPFSAKKGLYVNNMSKVLYAKNRSPFMLLILLINLQLLFLNVVDFREAQANAESKVQVVYMGKRPHDNLELITSSHYDILSGVLGSKAAAKKSMIYSYRLTFSGFAAKLTKSQAQRIAEYPGVVQVVPNHFYKLQTTRSWDYLDLPINSLTTNLLSKTNRGDGTIIAILDSGIWPESEAFNDEDLGPIPSKWKGFCQSGVAFDAKKACNKKLIGARYFLDGFLAEYGKPLNASENGDDLLSPRDGIGHGTHTASTAAGSIAPNASYKGLGFGTFRGGAPRARLAIYKVCWNFGGGGCAFADVLKAIDLAVHDGVDVISLSIGTEIPEYSDVDKRNALGFASLHAVEEGVVVVCSAGNSGPTPQSLINTAPWIFTVAASSIDRAFPTPVILGNGQSFVGEALFTGIDIGFKKLIYPEVSSLEDIRYCDTLTPNDTWVAGNVVLCFFANAKDETVNDARLAVKFAGGLGIIVAKNPAKSLDEFNDDFPCVQVSYDVGTNILFYIRTTSNPRVQLKPSQTYIGQPVSSRVASFSSRGPNSVAPAVLKPDVAAPGVNILAAFPTKNSEVGSSYELRSGTSMAAPHVSAIVAMFKSLHPDWSPAAIKSALITTAWTTDPYGEPIFAEGETTKLADPFDYGGGIINPNEAAFPGLIYDMGTTDYIHYLCAMGYNRTEINQLTGKGIICPSKGFSILDLNLPSITIPNLRNSTTLTRSVINVGPQFSTYKAVIEPPKGITIQVNPEVLIFNVTVTKLSFTATITTTTHKVNTEYLFGSLTWDDGPLGPHKVRIPISVKTEISQLSGL